MAGKVPAAAPGSSAPVGTAPAAAARSGVAPRRRPAAPTPRGGGPAPTSGSEKAGTQAVKAGRRAQTHRSYVEGLNPDERATYEQGTARARRRERTDRVTGTLDSVAQLGGGGGPVDTGAGFILGLLAWGWIGVPFLRGGPKEVKKVLLAKFLNKTPDGKFLP
jgi:hypothetical protein